MTVVADSTPLIHLSRISDLTLLRKLFGGILIPEAVQREVVIEGRSLPGARQVSEAIGDWIEVVRVSDPVAISSLIAERNLDRGEAEAIVLTQSRRADFLLMDERRAVACARSLGLEVFRTLAIYDYAKRLGVIQKIRPKIDSLRRLGFWLSEKDYEDVLRTFAGDES